MKKSRIKKRSATKPILGIFGFASAITLSTAAMAGAVSLVYAALEMPDSLVAKWLLRPLAATSVATVGASGGGLPSGVGSTTTQTSPVPASIKPTKLGINLIPGDYYAPTRIFANLAADYGWRVQVNGGGSADSYYDANRNVTKVNAGDTVFRYILRPTAFYQKKSADIICRWDGVGTVRPARPAYIKNIVTGANTLRYTHTYTNPEGWMFVFLDSVDANNPVRNFDCREAGADRNALFDQTYLSMVKPYNTVRFMSWQLTNDSNALTWSKRTTGAMGQIMGSDGVSIENMVALANQAQVNPWFCMSWNADDDYIRRFATMVRDTLDPNLKVYVELSNEVWNYGFPQTLQAQQEGLASGLSSNAFQAMLYRYAEKTAHVMDIWRDVFAGQSSRLVRVAASQGANPWTIQQVVQFRDTAQHIDAISSAPYFNGELNGSVTDLNVLFAELKTTLDLRMNEAKQYKQLADQHNLRFIAYEGGQHLLGDVTLMDAMNNDPRMGQLYTYYLQRWNNEIGDLHTLLADIGPTSVYGSWGHVDYIGQSPLKKPKAKAVMLFQATVGK